MIRCRWVGIFCYNRMETLSRSTWANFQQIGQHLRVSLIKCKPEVKTKLMQIIWIKIGSILFLKCIYISCYSLHCCIYDCQQPNCETELMAWFLYVNYVNYMPEMETYYQEKLYVKYKISYKNNYKINWVKRVNK